MKQNSFGWCRFDQLPQSWRDGFGSGAIVDHHPQRRASVYPCKLWIVYRSLMAGGHGFWWLLLIPLSVRDLRVDADLYDKLVNDALTSPLMLFLFALAAGLLVLAYTKLMSCEAAWRERALRQRGLCRYAMVADDDHLVARLPGPLWRGDRCLLLPRSVIISVDGFKTGTNTSEERETYLRFHCKAATGELHTVLLRYDFEPDYLYAAQFLNGWCQGRDLATSLAEDATAHAHAAPYHRLALTWMGVIAGLSILAWMWPPG